MRPSSEQSSSSCFWNLQTCAYRTNKIFWTCHTKALTYIVDFIWGETVGSTQHNVEIMSPEVVAHKTKYCNPQICLHTSQTTKHQWYSSTKPGVIWGTRIFLQAVHLPQIKWLLLLYCNVVNIICSFEQPIIGCSCERVESNPRSMVSTIYGMKCNTKWKCSASRSLHLSPVGFEHYKIELILRKRESHLEPVPLVPWLFCILLSTHNLLEISEVEI